MKIKSPFKDYYDHVAYQHGGGDPKILYPRIRIRPPQPPVKNTATISERALNDRIRNEWMQSLRVPFVGGFNLDIGHHQHWSVSRTRFGNTGILVVGLKAFQVILDYESTSEEQHVFYTGANARWKLLTRSLLGDEKFSKLRQAGGNGDLQLLSDPDNPGLAEMARHVGHPVYIIESLEYNATTRSYTAVLDERCPILSEIGLAPYYPAEQIYQDLSYFLGNLMHPSPDLMPPTEMSNKERILQHGFDLKASFRHRKA